MSQFHCLMYVTYPNPDTAAHKELYSTPQIMTYDARVIRITSGPCIYLLKVIKNIMNSSLIKEN